MKKIIFRLYQSIYLFFLRKIGSDKFTSKAAALSFTSFIVSILVFVLIVLVLKLLTTKNYFFILNKTFVFLMFFAIYLIVEFKIKRIRDKNL